VSFFRNLFTWRTATPAKAEPAPVPPSAAVAPTVVAPPPLPRHAVPAAAPVTPVPANENLIPFPLKAITDLFPAELQPAIRKHPSEHVEIQIPRDLIQPQLATGAVRLTFAQLRGITPEIFFHPETGAPETKLQLPLDLVVRKIRPARRSDQRQPSIPGNIPSVFAKAGSTPVPTAAHGAGESWYTPRRPTYEPKPEVSAPVAPAPAPAAIAPAPVATIPEPPKPAPQAVVAVPPPPAPEPPKPAPVLAAPIIPPAAPIPQAAPSDSLRIPLQSVAAALPQEIQATLSGAPTQTFVIPIAEFEPRMRTGRLRFKWSELRGWCVPPASATAAEDSDVDLPMATVVPLFLATRNGAAGRKKVEVDARIPDVFGKSTPPPAAEPEPAPAVIAPPAPEPAATPTPEPAPAPAASWESRPLRIEQPAPEPAPAEPPAPEPAPAAEQTPIVPEPAPVAAEQTPAPTAPAPAAATLPPTGPADAVRRIRELENVTGAFVATADGLLVAADIADGNANILAAFAPTVFAQLSKYADMAKLGRPEAIEMHLGLTTIHVRKAGKLYLGILMPPGHSFPLAAVTPISTALQPHST
jgi:predicted regulator of Ras-like GTPase activity (Roadblock/LC7/MglB family)